jgi:drug/metabolite transporter (DMT)-like permease
MNNTVIAALAGLVSSFCWGIGDFFAARASKDTSPAIGQLVSEPASAFIYSLVFLLFMRGDFHVHTSGVLYCIAAGVFMTLAGICFFRGLHAGPVSLVSPIAAAYPLFTTVILMSVFQNKLNIEQLCGIAMIVVGVAAASGPVNTKASAFKLSKGIKYAIATAILWGIGYALLGPAVASVGWQTASLLQLIVMTVTYLLLFPVVYPSVRVTLHDLHPYKNRFALINAMIAIIAIVVFNFGITYASSAAVVTAISASYPAITIFLARKQFKEKTQLIPLSGGFISILGVILLSVS